MKRSRFSEEQIIGILREQEAGSPTADVCRKHGVSSATFYKWKAKFGGLDVSDARRLKALEDENGEAEEAAGRDDAGHRDPEGHQQPKVVTPAAQRQAVAHACAVHEVSERRACQTLGVDRSSMRYRSRRAGDAAVRLRIRELAAQRRRFGYRRLHLLLTREGCHMNQKRFRRLYREEKLQVRKRGGRKRALGVRAPIALPNGPNERWSLDFVSDAFTDGRRFRILAIVDDFTRESLALIPDTSLSGARVARELDALIARRGRPKSCVSDNGTELTSMAILKWTRDERRGLALHRARQAAAERLRRELHRPAARRVPERDAVRIAAPGPRRARRLAGRLQRRAPAFGARQQDTGGVPSPAHCRCSEPGNGQNFNPGLYF